MPVYRVVTTWNRADGGKVKDYLFEAADGRDAIVQTCKKEGIPLPEDMERVVAGLQKFMESVLLGDYELYSLDSMDLENFRRNELRGFTL